MMSYTNGIGNLQHALSLAASTSTKPVADAATSETNGSASAQASVQVDQANLSSTGGIMAQALDGSDARPAKVAALQQAIASGSYNVPSSDVAEKVIDSLLK
jgi:negative regulator of flagellin synthesis FlgM